MLCSVDLLYYYLFFFAFYTPCITEIIQVTEVHTYFPPGPNAGQPCFRVCSRIFIVVTALVPL